MAEQIRRKTHHGREIVDFMLNVMRGENFRRLSVRDRIEAAKFLSDRGWGRAVEQSVQLRLEAGQTPEILDELPTGDLVNLIRTLQEGKGIVDVTPTTSTPLTTTVNPMKSLAEQFTKTLPPSGEE